jgi:hypothetical protein
LGYTKAVIACVLKLKIAVVVLVCTPAVVVTFRPPSSPRAGRHVIPLSAAQMVLSLAVPPHKPVSHARPSQPPILTEDEMALAPKPAPASTSEVLPSAGPFGADLAVETRGPSKLDADVVLPLPRPGIMETDVRTERPIPKDGRHKVAESDTHSVATIAVPPILAVGEGPAAPAPAPSN